DSQFGIRGLGTPGRWESVRARATGGAFAPFDAFSPLLDATIADVHRLTAGVTGGTSWRSVEIGGAETSLRSSRFPAFVIAGPLSRRVAVAGGFATYLDKSFGVRTTGDTILRGQLVSFRDEITSDGAVADLRLAVAARLHSRLALGVALHRLTGSTRVSAVRRFEDSVSYRTSTARDDVAYGGFGGSAGALLDLTPDLRLAGWVRSDTRLTADVRGRTTAEDDLPFAAGGGVAWRPGTQAVIAGAVAWRFWAGAGPDAYDTFSWSVGAELGSLAAPVRFGMRGGELPFGPGGAAPTEFALAAGVGRQFSGGRGRLDFGVERLERKGAGLTERVWTLLLGLTVRP
ncbi:MAG: hypothetical protein ACREMC_09570, partial [Gemmatimonadales bacterium]